MYIEKRRGDKRRGQKKERQRMTWGKEKRRRESKLV